MAADCSMGWSSVHFTQFMRAPDGRMLHEWRAVATVVWYREASSGRWIEHRWHASLVGDRLGSRGRLLAAIVRHKARQHARLLAAAAVVAGVAGLAAWLVRGRSH